MLFVLKKFLLVLTGSFLVISSLVADDIDLFTGVTPKNINDAPNVLIILDNTANWNAAFTNEINALASVLAGLDVNKFRVGLMMFSETGAGNSNPDGGYIRAAVRPMNAGNKVLYQNLVNSLHVLNDKSNNGKLGLAMTEAYYYFSGMSAYAGHNKAKRDYAGNVTGVSASKAIYALEGNAFTSSGDTVYENPVSSGCQKNYIIYISNGPVQDNSSDTATANSKLSAAGGVTTQISLSPSGSQSGTGDEWARFMVTKSSTKIITYTIDVDPKLTGQGPGFTALLKSMANQGKGKYFAVNSSADGGAEVSTALNNIFSEIQSVDTVFASASLPLSVNAQGTYLNQIFLGMFRPDSNGSPRWTGNLKQYKFEASSVNNEVKLRLVDANNQPIVNDNSGFITQCARSFWTPATTNLDTYWSFSSRGSCSAITNSEFSNTPDGEVVEKGAAGYMLRAINPTSRNMKTCDPDNCNSLTNFNDANSTITQVLLNVTNSSKRTDLINWVRGSDVKDENINGNTSEMRPSVHGDVVHSRPVAIDYGGSTGVVVFYGAGDGALHAINGNQTSNIGSFAPGSELWSFVAPEHYGKLKRLYDNTPAIIFPSTNGTTAKPYFFDGRTTAYQNGGAVWLYATQRRGGRMIYAFDVSTPTNPGFKWRQGCPNLMDDIGCTSSDFNGIGQTWSAAINIRSSGYVSGTTPLPMLIFGGGYDTCEDGDGANDLNTCSTPKGNKIFVVDASNGTLLTTLATDRSVAGDITVVPNAISGLAEYAYVVDTGGNIYRISMGVATPSNWTITKIAALGCSTTNCPGGVANRKFLFAPEVVVTQNFNYVLVGSGDREHPLLSHITTTSVNNAFFMIKDKPSDLTWWASEAANCQSQALACMNSLVAIEPDSAVAPSSDQLAAKKGWYLQFGTTANHAKEQVVTSAIVVRGVVIFSTHAPTDPAEDSCGSNLGLARVYNLHYLDGSAVGVKRFAPITGGGLGLSPISGMVTVNNVTTGKEYTTAFIISGGSNECMLSDAECEENNLKGKDVLPSDPTSSYKARAYWYLQQ